MIDTPGRLARCLPRQSNLVAIMVENRLGRCGGVPMICAISDRQQVQQVLVGAARGVRPFLPAGMEERSWAQYSTVDKSVLHRFSILRCRGGALPAVIFMAGAWEAGGAKERGEERRGEEGRGEERRGDGKRRNQSKKGSIRQNEM
jgi:hypothetical protein